MPGLDSCLRLYYGGKAGQPQPQIFVTGAYAALQLGPDAANLSGGVKAARIITDALMEQQRQQQQEADELPHLLNIHELNNPFDMLLDTDDESDSDAEC